MPKIAASYSEVLHDLLLQKKVSLDAVEYGPWQSVSALEHILPDLGGYPAFYHGSNLTVRTGLLPGFRTSLTKSLQLIRPGWFSTHISLLPAGWTWLSIRLGIYLPPPPLDWLRVRFLHAVQRLKKEYPDLPLLLENMPVDPRRVYLHLKSAGLVREILEKTGCGLLLDLPHARIAAQAFGMDTNDYLRQLPLERVLEIHTSGPRRQQDGVLTDRHQEMQVEDYSLLNWALAHTPAKLVTLEYFKDPEALCRQVAELTRLVETVR